MRKVKPAQPNGQAVPAENTAIIASLIHHRERGGRSTTLRDLHKISELTQSEALKAIATLENEGMVELKRNTHDAFESEVILREVMRSRLDDISRRNAA